MRRPRISLLTLPAVALAATVMASTALAASPASTGPNTKPQVTDPKGDEIYGGPAMDIVSGLMTTSGTTATVHGKKVYTPDHLVFSMTMAGAPNTSVPSKYAFWVDVAGCGTLKVEYMPGAFTSPGYVDFLKCPTPSTSTSFNIVPTVKGDTVTWAIPFDHLPPTVTIGTKFTDFDLYTAYCEPVTGIVDTEEAGVAFDKATSTATYTLG